MNLQTYRKIFFSITLGLIIVVSSPVFFYMFADINSEPFSELWLFGPDNIPENYPKDILPSNEYAFFVGVTNNRGSSEYYKILLKLSNNTVFLPDLSENLASSLPVLYADRFFLADGKSWESQINFSLENVYVEAGSLHFEYLTLNEISLPLDFSTPWNPELKGGSIKLFMELWRYDVSLKDFIYDGQFVALNLNVLMQY